jgi:Trypsin
MKSKLTFVEAVVLAAVMITPAAAITNGQPDAGRHRYVGLLVFDDAPGHPAWRCSGSLLSQTVILTAGHCTDGAVAARVWFDESVEGNPEYPFGGTTSYEGVPHTNPDFCIGCRPGLPGFAYRDVGVVTLTESVPTSVVSRYASLPSAGLVDFLMNKTPLDLVGYGVQEQVHGHGPPIWAGLKIRLYAPSELVSGQFAHSAEFIKVALNPGGGSGWHVLWRFGWTKPASRIDNGFSSQFVPNQLQLLGRRVLRPS